MRIVGLCYVVHKVCQNSQGQDFCKINAVLLLVPYIGCIAVSAKGLYSQQAKNRKIRRPISVFVQVVIAWLPQRAGSLIFWHLFHPWKKEQQINFSHHKKSGFPELCCFTDFGLLAIFVDRHTILLALFFKHVNNTAQLIKYC